MNDEGTEELPGWLICFLSTAGQPLGLFRSEPGDVAYAVDAADAARLSSKEYTDSG